MTRKFPAASKLATLLAAAALVAVGATSASAQSKQQYDKDGRPYYGANGPNRSYQQGRTRVYVTTRSWLDAGTEVLPGDRKFTGLRISAGDRVPNIRARKPQPADRPPAAQPAIGYGWLPGADPAAVLIPAVA